MERDSFEKASEKYREAAERLRANDFQGALDGFAAALGLLTGGASPARARILGNMGHILVRLQRHAEAMAAFGEAYDIFTRLGERNEAAEQAANCGSVCRDTGNWGLAEEHYRTALSIFEETGQTSGIANQYSNIAFIHSQNGGPDEAVRYFRMAQDMFTQLGDDNKAELCKRNILALGPFLATDAKPLPASQPAAAEGK